MPVKSPKKLHPEKTPDKSVRMGNAVWLLTQHGNRLAELGIMFLKINSEQISILIEDAKKSSGIKAMLYELLAPDYDDFVKVQLKSDYDNNVPQSDFDGTGKRSLPPEDEAQYIKIGKGDNRLMTRSRALKRKSESHKRLDVYLAETCDSSRKGELS